MHWVYIIQSRSSSHYYIGSTSDIPRRLHEHNSGKNRSTRNKGPYDLVYKEKYGTKQGALVRELKIKSYKGGNAFKKLFPK
ncbi:MAG: GIY-YIG nuclease family protein [Candidatus Levyibacteriota bacterium]